MEKNGSCWIVTMGNDSDKGKSLSAMEVVPEIETKDAATRSSHSFSRFLFFLQCISMRTVLSFFITAARTTKHPVTRQFRRQHAMAYPINHSNPTDLLSKVPEKFDEARSSGQLFFFPSEAKDVISQGRRVCSFWA